MSNPSLSHVASLPAPKAGKTVLAAGPGYVVAIEPDGSHHLVAGLLPPPAFVTVGVAAGVAGQSSLSFEDLPQLIATDPIAVNGDVFTCTAVNNTEVTLDAPLTRDAADILILRYPRS